MELDNTQVDMLIDYTLNKCNKLMEDSMEVQMDSIVDFDEVDKLGLCAIIMSLITSYQFTNKMKLLYSTEIIKQQMQNKNTQLLKNSLTIYDDLGCELGDILWDLCIMFVGQDEVEDLLN